MKAIDLHQRAIEVLEAIRHFERRKQTLIDNINGFCGTFPELRRRYENQVDTIDRCIARMGERYVRCIADITAEAIVPTPKPTKQAEA